MCVQHGYNLKFAISFIERYNKRKHNLEGKNIMSMLTLAQAKEILPKHTTEQHLFVHAAAVSAAMGATAFVLRKYSHPAICKNPCLRWMS